MKLHVLVEGASEKAFLDPWLRRFIPQHSFNVIIHRGKGHLPQNTMTYDQGRQGLLDQLPAKLRAFGQALNSETGRLLVLVDQDFAQTGARANQTAFVNSAPPCLILSGIL